VRRQSAESGGRDFLRFEGRAMTFGDVERRSNQVAAVLRARGVRAGDRVGQMLPNGFEFPVGWLALAKLGAVLVPLNVQYRRHDLAYALDDSGASIVLAAPEHAPSVRDAGGGLPALREVIEVSALAYAEPPGEGFGAEVAAAPAAFEIDGVGHDTLLNIQYTSGTTGAPKGCMLTHEYWLLIAERSRDFARMSAGDVALTAQPFYYMDPQWNTLMCALAGVPLQILPRFSPSTFWRSVRDSGATFLYLLGTMPVYLLKQPPDPEAERGHRLRFVACSGIVPSMHATFEERWGVPWREAFGMTETGVDLVVPIEDAASVGTGAMGRPVPGKEAKVVAADGTSLGDGEVGELAVRGRPMMRGYWNKPEATAERIRDGWLHTGDLAYRDARGYYHLVGRLKDMIRRSGENVSAAEVEGVLAQHPAVRAAAVVPVADELRGEEVKAFIQLQPGEAPDDATAASIVAWTRERLAAFKVPRFVEFVDDFPRTPSERVEKHTLLARRADQREGCWDAQSAVFPPEGR